MGFECRDLVEVLPGFGTCPECKDNSLQAVVYNTYYDHWGSKSNEKRITVNKCGSCGYEKNLS
jgi:predicted Zn-ribbon and HTH transcriptional regulator